MKIEWLAPSAGLLPRTANKSSLGRFFRPDVFGFLAVALLSLSLLSAWTEACAGVLSEEPARTHRAVGMRGVVGEEQHVREVIDGDTLRLVSGVVVRLKEVDAPELGHGKAPDQYYARQAREGLRTLCAGRGIRLEIGTISADRYGRVLAYVHAEGGRCLNQQLIEQGLATYYPHPGQDSRLSARLLAAQISAMDRGAGFWTALLQRPEMQRPCIGNSRSLRFFPAGCRHGEATRRSSRVTFTSAEQAFRAGYAPARPCGFWPLADAMP